MKLARWNSEWLILPFLAAVIHSAAQWTGPSPSSAVNTSSGLISGHAAKNRTDILEYLGIPYAQPPIGKLRFAPPQPYSSSEPFNASSYVGLHSSAQASFCQTD